MSAISRFKKFWTRGVLADPTPATADYTPGALRPGYWWYDQLPPFTIFTADWMLQDPQVRFGLKMLDGPLHSAEVEVTGPNKVHNEFVKKQWGAIWARHSKDLLRTKRYGYAGFEILYKIKSGQVIFDRLKDLHPYDTKPLTSHGKLLGIRVRHVKGDIERGSVDVGCPKALWLINDREFGKWFGFSTLEGAYEPWYEKRMRGGGIDLRKLRMMKDAWVGEVIEYPPEKAYRVPNGTMEGQMISARDIAREMMEIRASGGTRAMPQSYDSKGNKEWNITPPTSVTGATPILEYVDKLDWEIWKGIGLVQEVVEAAESGSGYAGRSVPFAAFLSSREVEFGEIISQVDLQVLQPLVRINFGDEPDYQIRPKPLIESMKLSMAGGDEGGSQSGGSQGGQGPPQPPRQMPQPQQRPLPMQSVRPFQLSAEQSEDPEANSVAVKGLKAGGLLARDLQSEVLSRLKKNGLTPNTFDEIDAIVDRIGGALEQAIGDTIFASNVFGALDTAESLPAQMFQDDGVSGIMPPREPPTATDALYPEGDGEPYIKFEGLNEAIANLTERRVVTPDEFYNLAAGARAQAFTVSADLRADTREKLREILTENITEGETFPQFMTRVKEELPGLPIGDGHLEQVFRNNTNTAYSSGIEKVLDHPVVDSGFPYRAYYAIHDGPRVRPWHLALERTGINGTNVYHKNDPVWRLIIPPNDFNCRCGWAPMSIGDAAAAGVVEAQQWDRDGIEPQHEFVTLPEWIVEHFRRSKWRNN